MRLRIFLAVVLTLSYNFSYIFASSGDGSAFYGNCVKSCRIANCTKVHGEFTPEAALKQNVWCKLLKWNCVEECGYHCMWRTVDKFNEHGMNIPKFHGKWPFVRIMGVQEPASAFFSLLNLISHFYMFLKMIKKKPPRKVPIVQFWIVFSVICMHAWVWSTIFHTRDTPYTEFMDYACALSMVMSLFLAAIIRIFYTRKKLTAVIVISCLYYLYAHIQYLAGGVIDYGFNMTVNIFFGVLGGALWAVWGVWTLLSGRGHAKRLLAFVAASAAALTLELWDFPPLAHAVDAHALWHLATAPLPLLFYRFVMDDISYLQGTPIKLGKMI